METLETYVKDPNEVLDYKIDWHSPPPPEGKGPWLIGSDTIESSEWIVPAEISQDDDSNDTTTATVWVSGGTDGEDYELTNRITTVEGRTADRSIVIAVRAR
jgi:hypothetical protein